MTDVPADASGVLPPLRTLEEVCVFLLRQEADAQQLAADLADPGRQVTAGEALARLAEFRQAMMRVLDWTVDQEVEQVTVPDYPPGAADG